MIAILSSLTFSNVQAQQSPAGNLTVSVSGAATWIALSVYAPNVAAGLLGTTAVGYTSMSLGLSAMANQKETIKNAVNSDVQDFYTTGHVSAALEQTISLLKKNNTELSDSEALDLLVRAINE